MKLDEYVKFPRAKVDELTITLSKFLASGQPCEFADDIYTVYPSSLIGEVIYSADEPYSKSHITTQPNIENSITKEEIDDFSFNEYSDSEEERIMKLNKGIRKRADGRYDWRKTICGISHYLIHNNLKELVKNVSEYKKNNFNIKPPKKQQSKTLINLAWTWFNLNKKGKIASERQYSSRLSNYISALNKNIDTYTKNDIIGFLNSIDDHKTREYCYIIIKNVFAEATESGLIKRNIIATLKNDKGHVEKGIWYNVQEQQRIFENLDKCKAGNEIEFFLMVGCRLSESYNCKPDFDKRRIWVERTKIEGTSGFVPISEEYAEKLKSLWGSMFKNTGTFYSNQMRTLLKLLGIKRQKNEKPIHRLRHTFATNLFYLGVNDKKRAYLLGHKTTKMTNDIYTDFDLDVSKSDITNIYGNLYPNFDPNFDPKNSANTIPHKKE